MQCIVTTTIQSPTEATLKFANMPDWHLIVVGDQKTPHNEYRALKNITYLSPDDQDKIDFKLSEAIGWNKIQRRSMGFIEAYKMGAEIIATVDTDNLPLDNWGKEIYAGKEIEIKCCNTDALVFDPLSATDMWPLWHRGFPLQLLQDRKFIAPYPYPKIKIDIQANLWNGDLDVCSLQRFIWNCKREFGKVYYPFTSNKFSPFNSQNTILTRDVIPNYFMMIDVGRFDDVIGSYYVQSLGFKVGYFEPTVYQEREGHDNTKDMVNEFWGYENTLKIIKDLYTDPNTIYNNLPERSAFALRLYQKNFKG